MKKILASFAVLGTSIAAGLALMLTPNFGINFAKKPEPIAVSLLETSKEERNSSSTFDWQNNIDKKINPKPELVDYLFPFSLCKTITYSNDLSKTQWDTTSYDNRITEKVEEEINSSSDFDKTIVKSPKNYVETTQQCRKEIDNKVIGTNISFQALASDDDSDRGAESIFAPDDVNTRKAEIRDKKIKQIIEKIKVDKPNIIFSYSKPIESVITEQEAKLIINKEYPLGTSLEKEEIISVMRLIDSGAKTNKNISNILARHRGVKITTTKQLQTQQIVTFPAPVGFSPLLLLLPPVRITTFAFVRVVLASNIYLINRVLQLGFFTISKLLSLGIYSLRLLKIWLKKFGRFAKKNIILFSIWMRVKYQEFLVFLAHEVRVAKIRMYIATKLAIKKTRELKFHSIRLTVALTIIALITYRRAIDALNKYSALIYRATLTSSIKLLTFFKDSILQLTYLTLKQFNILIANISSCYQLTKSLVLHSLGFTKTYTLQKFKTTTNLAVYKTATLVTAHNKFKSDLKFYYYEFNDLKIFALVVYHTQELIQNQNQPLQLNQFDSTQSVELSKLLAEDNSMYFKLKPTHLYESEKMTIQIAVLERLKNK
jgi:hypothetical protein